jgi:NifU-like protein
MFSVTDREIEKAVRENRLTSVEQVTNYTKAGGGCGNCHGRIQEILDWERAEFRKSVRPKLIDIRQSAEYRINQKPETGKIRESIPERTGHNQPLR